MKRDTFITSWAKELMLQDEILGINTAKKFLNEFYDKVIAFNQPSKESGENKVTQTHDAYGYLYERNVFEGMDSQKQIDIQEALRIAAKSHNYNTPTPTLPDEGDDVFEIGDIITDGLHEAEVIGEPERTHTVHVIYLHNNVADHVDVDCYFIKTKLNKKS